MIDTTASVLGFAAEVVLLLAGRRLFWLFVELVGFFAGIRFASLLLPGQDWTQWLAAALCGVTGMVLAVLLQRAAVAVAGFLVGGLFAADRHVRRNRRRKDHPRSFRQIRAFVDGLQPEIDPEKMNQLLDQLEAEDVAARQGPLPPPA